MAPTSTSTSIKRLNKEFKVSEADAREIVELAYAEENPRDLSVWGVVNGITSAAKAHRYAEDRTRVGALAGRVLTAASRLDRPSGAARLYPDSGTT